ncbi:MAG: hypothetical protein OEX75_00690 [Gammaproteobacteria bacterium]|nr:hypothetical protein [Gammaproteobacteria bacterium]
MQLINSPREGSTLPALFSRAVIRPPGILLILPVSHAIKKAKVLLPGIEETAP